MSALLIIIDEYAELADEAPGAMSYTDSIARLGRAVAVTLIAATQRPTQKAMGQGVCRARTCALSLSWCFLRSLSCPVVLVDQAVDDLPARDPGSHIDRLTGLVQRRSLFPRLVRPMIVVMPRVLGQDPPEVPFTMDQQVIEALAPQRAHVPLRK